MLTLLATACQNNGDIGDMYGVWRLDSYTLDGEPCHDKYIDNTTFSFQNNIVEVISQYDNYMSAYQTYGHWIWRNDGTLMLSFQQHDDTGLDQSQYNAPYWIGFTKKEVMIMQVSDRTGSRMTLSWEHDGMMHVYKLKKMD